MELQFEPRYNVLSRIYRHSEVIIVGILVAFYLFISNYYYWSATMVLGGGLAALPTSGGSDPYYNFQIILHILTYHSQLIFDPSLNYPLGTTNPRNPFFHWFIVLVAEILSPFMNVDQAAFYAFEEFNAVFGALLIIPVYLIAKEIFGKNTAAVAAMLYALMPSNLSAGILSGGRMHTPELIFAFFAIYFFVKAIKMSQKGRIIEDLRDFRHYHTRIIEFFNANRIPTIYALLAGASLGGLMLSWQGYAYIEAILLMYVAVQLLVNLFLKRPTGYVTFYTALFVILGFAMGAYYYIALGEASGWYNAEILIGIVMIFVGIVIGIVGRRPWILIIPILAVVVIAAFEGMAIFSPALLDRLLSGEGYFIKTRVYATIAEAAAPQLGSYIGGFGVAQFMLGLTGLAYTVYLYFKDKSEHLLYILVFSLVSIYMSFAAARFNITAAPAYAILGAAMLMFFAKVSRLDEIKKKKPSTSASPLKAIRGNIKGLQTVFVVLITALLIIPSATFMVSAAVPYGSTAQGQIESQIGSSIPSFLQTNNTTNFVGGLSGGVTNGSTPLSKSLAWLSTQDANVPVLDKPAYVSWWDYGFQQLYQGKHPSVADDFQQGIPIAGQTLLAQNNSQIISLFIGRLLQANYNNGNFSSNVTLILIQDLGASGYSNLINVSKNPDQYKNAVLANPTVYGQYISGIDSQNVYFAYIKGYLASTYSTSAIINTYQDLISATGNSIKYIQIPTDNSIPPLLPISATDTGIFYAPAYLTYTPSYATAAGGVIPTGFYNIFANTANGTFSLQNLPSGLIPTSYNIQYTPQFYNTSIYRFTIGIPPSAVGQTYGIPGIDYGATQYTAMPAWNMSNFLLVYENIPFNPYKDYQAHPTAWTTVPLQEAYTLKTQGVGTVELMPPVSTLVAISDPIVAYYPGAIVHGQITMPNGDPVPGVHVTVFDQYGIPHEVVTTNSQGYYNITALPGNDSLFYSTGPIAQHYLIGSNSIGTKQITISQNQGNRIATSYNKTTGLPDYYLTENYRMGYTNISGSAKFQYQQYLPGQGPASTQMTQTQINDGSITYSNSTYNLSYTAPIINGNYSFTNLPPISYEVAITTGGHTYSNLLLANVSNGGNLIYNMIVAFDTIFANVSLSGSRLQGLSVATTGTGYVAGSTLSNSTGTAKIWVTPGNYTISLSGNNLSSNPASAGFSTWGQNVTGNLTPLLSSTVSIGINGYSGPANVTLYKNGLMSAGISLAYSNGRYSGSIPYGVYTEYVLSPQGSYLNTVTINSTYYANVTLSPLANLTLASNMKGSTTYSGQYELLTGHTYLQYSFNSNKNLQIQLPEGSYEVSGIGVYTGGSHSGFQTINVYGNSNFNLSLTQNNTYTALVFNSGAGSTYNAKSAVNSGIVIMKLGNTPLYFTIVNSQGIAQLYYPSYAAGSMSLSYENAFYSAAPSITASGSQASIPVTQITSQFTLELSQTSLASTTQYLHLTSDSGSYNITLTSGTGTVDVPLGFYLATLSSANSLIVANPAYLAVNSPHMGTYHLGVTEYSNVTSSTAQVTRVFYLNGTEVSDKTMLPTGTYQVYSYNSSRGASLSTQFIQGNTVINPTYSNAYSLGLSNSQAYSAGVYTITKGSSILNVSGGSIALPSGAYTVTYRYSFSNATGSYTYTGSKAVDLNSNTMLNLSIAGQQYFSPLSGYATFGGGASMYTTVMLVNAAGDILNTTTTNSAGYYSMNVPTGENTIYAKNTMSNTAYFGAIDVPAFSSGISKNLTMSNGYYVTASVNMGSKIVNNPVNITSGNARFAFDPMSGSIFLPVGSYGFQSSTSTTETTMDGSILTVTYSTGTVVQVNSDMTIPLTLSKNVVHSFQANLISGVATIGMGGNLTYTFNLTNTGNSNESIFLASTAGTWTESFNPSTLTLMPGQSANITVNATLNGNLAYGSENLPVSLGYIGGSTTLNLPVNVKADYNYSVSENGFPVYNGNMTLIPVLLNNTGNAPLTVYLSLNQTMLQLNGWHGSFILNSGTNNSVYLPFGTSKVVYVSLNATVSQPVYPFSFTLNTNSTTAQNGTLSISQQLSFSSPQSASVVPYPSGANIIANYTGSPLGTLLYGILIIAVAVVGGLIATAYRSRKK